MKRFCLTAGPAAWFWVVVAAGNAWGVCANAVQGDPLWMVFSLWALWMTPRYAMKARNAHMANVLYQLADDIEAARAVIL